MKPFEQRNSEHGTSLRSRRSPQTKSVDFVQDRDVLTSYCNEIKVHKNLTLAEEKALAERIQKGDKGALNELVQANLKFVVAVCRNYQYQSLPMGDLINEGNLGLIRAAQRFDATLNFKFISYAVWWIRQAILTALAEQSKCMNISAGKVTVIHRIGKVNQKLEQKLGRPPLLGELAEAMGKSEQEITECLQLAAAPLSLTSPVPGETDGTLEDHLRDENGPGTDAEARQFLLGENLKTSLASLEEREEMVLRMYYGIEGKTAFTLEEIASKVGLTRERIRQIKDKAIKKLRHPSRSRRLAVFQS